MESKEEGHETLWFKATWPEAQVNLDLQLASEVQGKVPATANL